MENTSFNSQEKTPQESEVLALLDTHEFDSPECRDIINQYKDHLGEIADNYANDHKEDKYASTRANIEAEISFAVLLKKSKNENYRDLGYEVLEDAYFCAYQNDSLSDITERILALRDTYDE